MFSCDQTGFWQASRREAESLNKTCFCTGIVYFLKSNLKLGIVFLLRNSSDRKVQGLTSKAPGNPHWAPQREAAGGRRRRSDRPKCWCEFPQWPPGPAATAGERDFRGKAAC